MIEFRHVTKTYNGAAVVCDVTLGINDRQTTVLIGPSGSGKSTLLQLIVGLELPDRGVIEIDGRPLSARTLEALRRTVGYVIQDGGLFPHMTARENIELMARVSGWGKARRWKKLESLCSLTQFPVAALDRYPVELSGGQSQRVSLMRALMLDPGMILMDEPMGALDPMIRRALQDDLQRIFKKLAKTVVLVTHDLNEAAFFADEIVLLNKGKVEQQGLFSDFVKTPATAFVTQFVEAQLPRFTPPERR
jgi:osmoprotectant transport system ATP-binding protein